MLRWQNRTVFILWSPREGGKDSEREQRGEASRRCLLIGRKGFCLAGVHRMKCWRQSNKLPRWAGLIRSADVNGRVWIIVMLSLAEQGRGRLENSVCVKSLIFFLSSESSSWLCKAVIMQQINRWTSAILRLSTWAFTKLSKQAIVNHIRYVFFPHMVCPRPILCTWNEWRPGSRQAERNSQWHVLWYLTKCVKSNRTRYNECCLLTLQCKILVSAIKCCFLFLL